MFVPSVTHTSALVDSFLRHRLSIVVHGSFVNFCPTRLASPNQVCSFEGAPLVFEQTNAAFKGAATLQTSR